MPTIAVQIFALLVPLMQSPSLPLRIGDVGPQLTDADVVALGMVLPATPWLLNGTHSQLGLAQWVQAFLPPALETQALRRGTIIYVERRISPVGAWAVQRTEPYAQVAIPGRRFDDIRDDHDINRPFRVIGQFENEDIVRLVEFLRSGPPTPAKDNPVLPWPIGVIERKADGSVEVGTSERAGQGQLIRLRQSGQEWVIVEMAWWAT